MVNFLLGLFATCTILLLVFIIKFYDFNLLKREKVSVEKIKNEKKSVNIVDDIDKNDFFR